MSSSRPSVGIDGKVLPQASSRGPKRSTVRPAPPLRKAAAVARTDATAAAAARATAGAGAGATAAEPPSTNQFALLRQRRFAPLFWTQFLGAANDNLFKFALTVLVTYQLHLDWLPPSLAGIVIGALFILPFLLFSATSGQLADKLDKTRIARWCKVSEVGIMAVAGLGFLTEQVTVLLGCVFLMGLHSTVFGPVKYALLPQHLKDHELTGGNGLIEMGTFVAILVGNIVGGLLIAIPEDGATWVASSCLALALVGVVTAWWMPPSPSDVPDLKINWNPVTESWQNFALSRQQPAVFRSILGISWMWFFGAVFLAQFPAFAHDVLRGNEQVASALLAVFSIGIGVGSLLCEKLSRGQVEIGLVPVGAIGMTVFAIDLYFACEGLAPPPADQVRWTLSAFLGEPAHLRVLADLGLLAASAGIYSVPMYALVQLRSGPTHRARIIAAINLLGAIFMVTSALFAAGLVWAGVSVTGIFLITGLLNALVAGYVFRLMPEYLLRFIAWLMANIVYRLRIRGESQIPADGPAIIAANHVSFVDAVLLMAISPRPIRFIMDHRIFATPLLGRLFRLAGAIPIAPREVDPETYARAFAAADQALADGELVGIFPEGSLTSDGRLQPFKGGIMKVLEQRPVPVIPVALIGLWGSYFSRADKGRAMTRPFRRGAFNRVALVVAAPMAPADVTPDALRAEVAGLLARASRDAVGDSLVGGS